MKRDLLVFGIVVAIAGILGMVVIGSSYVNGLASYYQSCTNVGYSSVTCQTAMAQNSLTSYWMFAGLAVFIVGLWATARSFMAGEDVLASKRAPPGFICPTCKTSQTGPFVRTMGPS